MSNSPTLQFSHLTDEDYLRHLYTKPNPTGEDIESALRLELLLGHFAGILDKIHQLASDDTLNARVRLTRIRQLTAPVELKAATLQ